MRTTLRLPDDLLKEAKKRAAERGTTLTALVEEALREALSRAEEGGGRAEPVSLTTPASSANRAHSTPPSSSSPRSVSGRAGFGWRLDPATGRSSSIS